MYRNYFRYTANYRGYNFKKFRCNWARNSRAFVVRTGKRLATSHSYWEEWGRSGCHSNTSSLMTEIDDPFLKNVITSGRKMGLLRPYLTQRAVDWHGWKTELHERKVMQCSLAKWVECSPNGPGDMVSIPGCVIPKTFKMVLDNSLLNTQQYKVRIKGKVAQSRERSSTLPYTSVL